MKFEYFENQSTVVEKKKKTTTFTVTPIGGPAELAKWRQMQEAKEAAYRFRLQERDDRVVAFQKEIGQKLDTPTTHGPSIREKSEKAKQHLREEAERRKKTVAIPFEWTPEPKPKQSIFGWIKSFFWRMWNDANF